MATVTLSYNARSAKAKMLLNMIITTGLFTPAREPNAKTLASIQEARQGISAGEVDLTSIDTMVSSMS